jgi:hypothetical protein
MKLRTLVAMILAALLCMSLVAGSAVAKKKKKQTGPVQVAEDVAGDWGKDNATGEDLSDAGDSMGMDLIAAEIGMADKATVNFVIKVNALPSSGGTPEVARYIWSVDVDGEYVELDGKFTNYSRGACDPTAGTCPPPRDPGGTPFAVRANCETVSAEGNAPVTTCQEVGLVQAIFDLDTASIIIPVPLELINAKKGSKIGPGSSDFTSQSGGTILAIPSAFVSRSDMPRDGMTVTGTYTVPKK